MAGRFERVFSLPENLYSTGSPVIVAAGALQKNSKTGEIFAQLKLQNICSTAIKAATVEISLFDIASRPMPSKINHQYLDINAGHKKTFGEKILIPVEDSSVRSFSVAVTEIVLADLKIWEFSNEPWEPLPQSIPLKTILNDTELLKEYQLLFGSQHIYQFSELKDLWHCSCGTWNHKSDKHCSNCQLSYAGFAFLDWDELKAKKEARIQQEIAEKEKEAAEKARIEEEQARQKAEKDAFRAAKRKKTQKILKKITISMILLFFIFIVSYIVIKIQSYRISKKYEMMIVGEWAAKEFGTWTAEEPSMLESSMLIDENGHISFHTPRIDFDGIYEHSGKYTSQDISNITTSYLLKSDAGALVLYLCDDGQLALILKVNGVLYPPVFFTRS